MLGARIAALRRAKGWSQGDLAQMLQVSPSAVGMYEQGRREPAVQTLVAMAKLFGVSVDYLLTGCGFEEDQAVQNAVEQVLTQTETQLQSRKSTPLSREELAVLFAALLMEH
ncbi:MAG: helix-turn-helix transcriptional regulator [Ruminococcaceae bacterium]|nr:helix-turn-helix transcriptional regulator [Oscillospiraceae bacterium]